MSLDHLHQQCADALDGLHYTYVVELTRLGADSLAVTVKVEGSDTDPCRGQHEVMSAARRVDDALHRAGWHHVGYGYGHSGGFTSWHVVRQGQSASSLSPRNRRRLLQRLQGYAERATDPRDARAFALLHDMLDAGEMGAAMASVLAANIHGGGRQRELVLWLLEDDDYDPEG